MERIRFAHRQQGIKRVHLDRKVEEHQELLHRIPTVPTEPTVPDLQSAWAPPVALCVQRLKPLVARASTRFCCSVPCHPTLPVALGGLKRSQNKSSSLLGQLGGLPPDASGETTRIAQVVRSLEEGVTHLRCAGTIMEGSGIGCSPGYDLLRPVLLRPILLRAGLPRPSPT